LDFPELSARLIALGGYSRGFPIGTSRRRDSVVPAENRSRAAASGDVVVQVKLTRFVAADFIAYLPSSAATLFPLSGGILDFRFWILD